MDATPFVLILLFAVAAAHGSGFALGRYERTRRRRVGSPE